MTYTCNQCNNNTVTRRNGQLQCARCGSSAIAFSAEEEINYERSLQRANALLTVGDYAKAHSEYLRLIDVRPNDIKPYLGVAATLSEGYTNDRNFYTVYKYILSAQSLLPLNKALPLTTRRYIADYTQKTKNEFELADERVKRCNMFVIGFAFAFVVFTIISYAISVFFLIISLYILYSNYKKSGNYGKLMLANSKLNELETTLRKR
jgi:tetratricopeptide (TPR) repeat protein